jgi:hypothetical protein
MGGMHDVEKHRPWWKFHLLTWSWIGLYVAASIAVNTIYVWERGTFGWPTPYAQHAGMTTFEGRERLRMLPFGESYIHGSNVVFNSMVCFGILFMSTYAVERWCRANRSPPFRFTLRTLFWLIAWSAVGCTFLMPSGEMALMRVVQWSLLIQFVGIGLALYGTIDVAIEHNPWSR